MRSLANRYRAKYYPVSYADKVCIDGTPVLATIASGYLSKGYTRVLDIGCGGTRGPDRPHPCKRQGVNLTGIDVDPSAVSNQDMDVYVCQSAESMAFRNESFDLVFSDFTIEHLGQPEKVVAEVHRVLRANGILLFRTVNAAHYVALIAGVTPERFKHSILPLSGREESFPTFYRLNTRGRIHRVLNNHGFRIREDLMIEGPPGYLAFSSLLYFLGVGYERIVNSTERLKTFRANLIIAAEKV